MFKYKYQGKLNNYIQRKIQYQNQFVILNFKKTHKNKYL